MGARDRVSVEQRHVVVGPSRALEALRWAIENGLPCDRENWQLCMSVAQMNGHLDMLTWLNENQALSH